MWGEHVGKLIVYVNGKQRFVKTGKQQNKWLKAEFKVQERASKVSKTRDLFNLLHCYVVSTDNSPVPLKLWEGGTAGAQLRLLNFYPISFSDRIQR